MKFFKIVTFYPSYIQRFYGENPGLAQANYATQSQALDNDAYGRAEFWIHALTALGYEGMRVIANIEPLQKAWAREHGITWSRHWVREILTAQVKQFQPDVLFLEDHTLLNGVELQALRQSCSRIRLVLGWCGSPYWDTTVFQAQDVVLSCIPELVTELRSLGHRSEHLNHAFDPRVRSRLRPSQKPLIPFSFIGQVNRNNQFHGQREQLLLALSAALPLQIYSSSAEVTWQDDLKVTIGRTAYPMLKALKAIGIPAQTLSHLPKVGKFANYTQPPAYPVHPTLKPLMEPGRYGLQMFQTLHDSQVTFNSHIDVSPRSASNMRLFEATGVGTCLVTDWKENLADLFEPDREVVTYRSSSECIEKVQWLLEHPGQRQAIAQAGEVRTLRDHTFTHRALQLDRLIRQELAR